MFRAVLREYQKIFLKGETMKNIVWAIPVSHLVIEEGSEDYHNGQAIVNTHIIKDNSKIIMKCPECIYEQLGGKSDNLYDKYSHIPREIALRSDKRPEDFIFEEWSKVNLIGIKIFNEEDKSFNECILGLDKNGESVKHTAVRLSDEIYSQMVEDLK